MTKNRKSMTIICLGAAVVFLLSTFGPAMAKDKPNPYLKADESWISISGTAVDVKPESFSLDYGEGTVLVEMDGWAWYVDTSGILEGDKVTVYGRIDDDWFETTSIEASSIYVESLGTYFYANSADEEGYAEDYDYWGASYPIVLGQTVIRGTVTSVNGREFTIDSGPRKMTVDTIGMAYNPMDDLGYQKIEKGDYVSVTGDMDYEYWEGKELEADTIITLIDDSKG